MRSDEFLVRVDENGAPATMPCPALFRDLTRADLESSLHIVAKVGRARLSVSFGLVAALLLWLIHASQPASRGLAHCERTTSVCPLQVYRLGCLVLEKKKKV